MVRKVLSLFVGLWLVALGVVVNGQNAGGWKLPASAAEEKNPFPTNDSTLAAGKKVFTAKCQRCHGPKGEGDGVDADTDLKKEMDLTRADRATQNPDGVVFYKIKIGRQEPRMPTFEDQLTPDQIWAAVIYTQSLRKK